MRKFARALMLGAPLAVFVGAAFPAATAAQDAAAVVADSWDRYRSVGTETETVDIVVISNPPADPLTRAKVEALIESGGPGVRPKKALRRVLYSPERLDKVLIVFAAPAEDQGTAFLVWRKPGRDQDEQWMYMPDLQRVRRIAVSSTASFVGTNMRYEDVRELSGESTANFTYELLPADAVNGRPCSVIQALPIPGLSTAYKRRKIWIDKEWHLPVKVEYFDVGETPWKVLHQSNVTQLPSGPYRADLLEVRDLRLGESSVILVTKRQVGHQFPPETFTTDYLERAGADL